MAKNEQAPEQQPDEQTQPDKAPEAPVEEQAAPEPAEVVERDIIPVPDDVIGLGFSSAVLDGIAVELNSESEDSPIGHSTGLDAIRAAQADIEPEPEPAGDEG